MAKGVLYKDKMVSVGDSVRLQLRVIEAGKERTQAFDGVVLALKGRGDQKSITVRKKSVGGVFVERTVAIQSPWLAAIEVKKPAEKVRRAKLYYLRGTA